MRKFAYKLLSSHNSNLSFMTIKRWDILSQPDVNVIFASLQLN